MLEDGHSHVMALVAARRNGSPAAWPTGASRHDRSLWCLVCAPFVVRFLMGSSKSGRSAAGPVSDISGEGGQTAVIGPVADRRLLYK